MGNFERHQRERVTFLIHIFILVSTEHVPVKIPNSSHSTHLSFQDKPVAIKMICKGRSPNLWHVTRRHRDDLDRLFERVNLDHSILIKYVRLSDQSADIFTKGMFTTM